MTVVTAYHPLVETLGPDGLVLTIIGAVIALATAWKLVVVPVMRGLRRFGHFLDDWAGEPARPGHPAEPGMPERVAAVEQAIVEVKRELKPNGGGSLRDAVDRVEKTISAKLDDHIAEATADRAELHRKLDDHVNESTEDRAALHRAVDALRVEARVHHDHDNQGGAS